MGQEAWAPGGGGMRYVQKPVLAIPLSWLWALAFSVFVWTCLIGLVVLLT